MSGSVSPLPQEGIYRLLVDSILDYAVYMLDPDGIVTSWNTGAERVKGYTAGEILGQHFSRFYTEDDQRAGLPAQSLANAARDGRFETEGWRIRRDGDGFWAHAIIDAIRSPDGTLIGFAKITHDLTERKVAEAREAQLSRLKSREKALQSQKMEAIGRLSAGVAHDFNNILQSIVGALELVCDDLQPETPVREFVAIALNAAIRGSSLTHHLLSYARKQILQPQLIELQPFLADMQKLLARTLGPHIAVELRVEQSPCVLVDPGQLQTALLNLAINAGHAMPKGGTLVMHTREEGGGEQNWVTIAVTDTGAGMDEAVLAQAVEPFFTTKGLDGTGLGLSMVQGFIEQSGGRFGIASVPGEGTTVELRLPCAALLREPHAHDGAAPRRVARILLVDDSPDLLMTVGAVLEKAGFAVVRSESGSHALEQIAAGETFDAMVTDYAMRGLNGLDLIAQARAVQPGLPALMITGFADLSFVDGLPEGTLLLSKPFQRAELIDALGQIVEPMTPADPAR